MWEHWAVGSENKGKMRWQLSGGTREWCRGMWRLIGHKGAFCVLCGGGRAPHHPLNAGGCWGKHMDGHGGGGGAHKWDVSWLRRAEVGGGREELVCECWEYAADRVKVRCLMRLSDRNRYCIVR